jgi:hypothetical protein
VPLAGIVHLRFADGPAAAQQVPLPRRIDLLRAQAPMRPKLPPNKLALLELAAMPTLELMRPRDLGALEASAAALLATLPS